MGRDGSLAVSLSTSGGPHTQEPDSKQVKRGNFWTWWIADVWHPLPEGAVDTGRLQVFTEGHEKEFCWTGSENPWFWSSWRLGKYLEKHCVHSPSFCSSLGVCLRPPFLIFNLRKQKSEGGSSGDEARPPVCPHSHPQCPPSWDTQWGVVENRGTAFAPGSVAKLRRWGWGWQLHTDSEGGAEAAVLPAVVSSPSWI